jgi:hypothetical protein
MFERSADNWALRIILVFVLGIVVCALMVMATARGAEARECLKSPSAVWTAHPDFWALKRSGCWEGSESKPEPVHISRGNRGHMKRKEVRHVKIATSHPDISSPSSGPSMVTAKGVVPIFQDDDNLSTALKRCADDWGKNHVGH